MSQVHHYKKILFILICTIITVSLQTVSALDSDSKEKVNIVADSVIYNYKSGIDVYEGHIRIDQGTTHITADRLVTKKNERHMIQEATAYGLLNLAQYWTVPKIGEPELHARAKIIKFYPIESNISLEQNAHVIQGENSFQGEFIHYNNKDQTITVPASKNGRAVIVYNPDKT